MTNDHPGAPTFEGRPLPRPDEEVVDQGLGFDVATLLSRRRLLRRARTRGRRPSGWRPAGARRLDGVGSRRRHVDRTSSGEIPDETAGPYPGDGSNGPDVLEQSGDRPQRHPVQLRRTPAGPPRASR